uniref:Uncharacterized protein n=1 Tax=Arundo donax TaxID=35708 RepID=A0A0A9DCA0_ARUDO
MQAIYQLLQRAAKEIMDWFESYCSLLCCKRNIDRPEDMLFICNVIVHY